MPTHNPYNILENTTNIELVCLVIDANPAATSYKWYKDSSIVSTMAIFKIPVIKKSHVGSYVCEAINIIGPSRGSAVVKINILCKYCYVLYYFSKNVYWPIAVIHCKWNYLNV